MESRPDKLMGLLTLTLTSLLPPPPPPRQHHQLPLLPRQTPHRRQEPRECLIPQVKLNTWEMFHVFIIHCILVRPLHIRPGVCLVSTEQTPVSADPQTVLQ